jgi:hypothetical protein
MALEELSMAMNFPKSATAAARRLATTIEARGLSRAWRLTPFINDAWPVYWHGGGLHRAGLIPCLQDQESSSKRTTHRTLSLSSGRAASKI